MKYIYIIEIIASWHPVVVYFINNKILIDQGLNDEFIKDLYLDDFIKICKKNNQKILIRKHKDHGHGYYFISTFIKDHIKFHKKLLS